MSRIYLGRIKLEAKKAQKEEQSRIVHLKKTTRNYKGSGDYNKSYLQHNEAKIVVWRQANNPTKHKATNYSPTIQFFHKKNSLSTLKKRRPEWYLKSRRLCAKATGSPPGQKRGGLKFLRIAIRSTSISITNVQEKLFTGKKPSSWLNDSCCRKCN